MKQKLSARALLFAIVVSLLIAIILGAFLMLSASHRFLQTKSFLQGRLIRNADAGIAYLLAQETEMESCISLYGEAQDSVCLFKRSWGLYDYLGAQSFHRQDSFSRLYLVGQLPEGRLNAALYLADRGKPLMLAGKTQLRGAAYLPKAGLKRGRAAGQQFEGGQLLYGEERRSSKFLPSLALDKLRHLDQLLTLPEQQTSLAPKIHCSFVQMPKYILAEELYLQNENLKGALLIRAEKAIYVGKEAQLEDVILQAPNIIFESGFEGSVQAIASDTIIVQANCHLKYPSVLAIYRNQLAEQASFLELDSASILEGIWVSQEEYSPPMGRSRHRLAPRSKVRGFVYSNVYLDMQADIDGQLMLRQLSLKTPAAVYENYLINVQVELQKRPEHFLLPDIFKEGSPKKRGIIKCLE